MICESSEYCWESEFCEATMGEETKSAQRILVKKFLGNFPWKTKIQEW